MTTVSAIPENLFNYSDTCTNGAEQVQTWVRNVLTPAVTAYQNGGGCVTAIDVDTAKQLAAAYYTDRDVRTVGQAFLQAGGVLVRGRNQPIHANEKTVNAAFTKLQTEAARQQTEAAHQVQINAGAALAKRLMGAKPVEVTGIIRELAKHGNDPYFSAGFYNNLDEQHIETAMAQGGIPALVSAYSSGVLDKKVYDSVNTRLARPIQNVRFAVNLQDHYMTAAQKLQFLNSIGANPVAARNFANNLTSGQLRQLFYGPASEIPGLRGSLTNALTVAMWQQSGQPQARALMHTVSDGLFGDGAPKLTHNQMQQLIGPLMEFYSAGISQSLVPPPGDDPIALRRWAEGLGRQNGQDLGLFLKAANETGDEHELMKSMIQGGYVNVLFMPTGILAPELLVGNIAFTAGVGAMQSLYSSEDPLTGLLDKLFPGGSHANTSLLNDRLAVGGLSLAVSSLISQGLVHPVGSDVPVKFGSDPVANAELVKKIMLNGDDYAAGQKDFQGHLPPSITDLTHGYRDLELGEVNDALGNPDYKPPE
ncbi:hypothetical protein ACFV1F_28615 [Streptomyces sp. NPDC059590]|uniref:hypothetical protein n=1 Tax=Streptomyces sp. NPDC059590 TaxID=3346877 RepID=UPI0036A9DF0F